MNSQAGTVSNDLSNEVRELNLAYLLLAQKMVRNNSMTAQVQLGLPESAIENLETMSFSQAIRIASTPMVMCSMRFDDEKLWNVMTDEKRDNKLASLHTAILSVCQPVVGE